MSGRVVKQLPLQYALFCMTGVNNLSLQESTSHQEAAQQAPASTRPKSAGPQPRRPLQEYHLENELQAACDSLAAADQAKPKLHLVVLGHVDAGKSTLMGRLLHDLG